MAGTLFKLGTDFRVPLDRIGLENVRTSMAGRIYRCVYQTSEPFLHVLEVQYRLKRQLTGSRISFTATLKPMRQPIYPVGRPKDAPRNYDYNYHFISTGLNEESFATHYDQSVIDVTEGNSNKNKVKLWRCDDKVPLPYALEYSIESVCNPGLWTPDKKLPAEAEELVKKFVPAREYLLRLAEELQSG